MIQQGKVRAIGASQFTPERLIESIECSRIHGLATYSCLQPLYNLYDRQTFEAKLAPCVQRYGLGVINYYSLAAGFLTGKYRIEADLKKSVRGAMRIQSAYFNDKGHRIIAALDQVASRYQTSLASVAFAWVLSNPLITAPIASATSTEQLESLVSGTELKLDQEALGVLNLASSF